MRSRSLCCALFVLAFPSCGQKPDAPEGSGLRLESVAAGLEAPLFVTAPAADPRLFILEQPGRIRVIRDGTLLERPFLDLTPLVSAGGERGLLGLAFHPRYAENGYFFVNYTNLDGDTRIVRYRVGADPDVADPTSAKTVLAVGQPYANHNGGMVLFGPDGMLYVGMGDGGSGGDPHRYGSDPGTLLAKLLRLDVDHGDPYAIPPDNPLVNRSGARGEIWAWGLRNPWRFCFDPPARTLYIADVGQDRWEEVNVVAAGAAGLDFGWSTLEGSHCFRVPNCDRSGLTMPVLEYGHDQGCSVTGGFVYRGRAIPWLAGTYFYADYCRGWVRSFRWSEGRVTETREWPFGRIGSILSFGQDAIGELYVCSSNGHVYRIVPASH